MINKSVMKCCICNNDNIGEFITINGKKYHLCCIEQLKKQKDDVVEYIKYNATSNYFDKDKNMFRREIDLLRMLGDKDV